MKRYILIITTALSLFASSAEAEPVGNNSVNGSIGAGARITILPASSNVAGAYIRTAVLVAFANGATELDLLYPDGTYHDVFQAGSNVYTTGVLPFQLSVPPGVGISVYAGTTNNGSFSITYDIVH